MTVEAPPGPSRPFLTSLHPGGDPSAILWIKDSADPLATKGKSDVVVLALTAAQCRDAWRREAMIEQALTACSPDGVIWVDAPGAWRAALMSTFRANGMATGALTVRRARGAGEVRIAVTARALRFALHRGHLSRRWWPVVAMLEWMPFGSVMLTRLLPGVGFAAFRSGSRPFRWLTDRLMDEVVDVALITNWRGEQAPYLVFALGAGQTLVAKRGGTECKAQITHETAMLKNLGPVAATCGLEVPRLIEAEKTAALSTLIEADVPGRPMAALIREGHHRDLGRIADRLSEWLACWNGQTLRHVEFTPELAERLILSAARPLASSIDRGSAYLDWLMRETGRLVGSQVSLVATHNDLTMANVLGDAAAIRSVVDWEAASPDGLPLTDYRYAVCDAAAAIGKYDRATAFRACFMNSGGQWARLAHSEAVLREIVGGPPEWLELCIHAGWLRHAANEQARSPSSRVDGSFIEIANLLANSVVGG